MVDVALCVPARMRVDVRNYIEPELAALVPDKVHSRAIEQNRSAQRIGVDVVVWHKHLNVPDIVDSASQEEAAAFTASLSALTQQPKRPPPQIPAAIQAPRREDQRPHSLKNGVLHEQSPAGT